MIDGEGKKLMVDYTLDKLQFLLDPKYFFRINRQYIIQVKAVRQVKPFLSNRLKLYIKEGAKEKELVVSRDRVKEFRNWAEL